MKPLLRLFRIRRNRLFFAGVLSLSLLAGLPGPASAQFKFREPPNRQDPDALQADAGAWIWQRFLAGRDIGAFQLEGSLYYRPARAASRVFDFRLDGNWSGGIECTTITLAPVGGVPISRTVVVQGNAVFLADGTAADGALQPLASEAMNQPVMEGLPFTWADIIMPYLRWNTAAYSGPERYLGRPAHSFLLVNPQAGGFPASVTVALDEDYAALLKADLRDAQDRLVTRVRVGGFRQFDGQWMFSEITWDHRATRDSVRLQVRAFSIAPPR